MKNDYSIYIKNANIFQREVLILTDVNFSVKKGEWVYLLGKVGSGKSSLIKTLNAEIPLYHGSGLVAGFELSKLKPKEVPFLRRKLGVVFQDFQLLSDRSVYKNLEFVLKATGWIDAKKINQKIEESLEQVGMLSHIDKMPHQLSGGEQQRIVIARALLNDPEIVLADEPTGNLDPETSFQIIELFKKINASNKTVVIATHDQLVIEKYPGRTVWCHDGELTEQTPRTERTISFREKLAD